MVDPHNLPKTPRLLRTAIMVSLALSMLASVVTGAGLIYNAFSHNTLWPFIGGLGMLWVTVCQACGMNEYGNNQGWDF